ncbi:MAG: MFS transporter, partial [Mesorhizobium sp.]
PYLVGYLKDLTGTTQVGMYELAAILMVGAILVLTVPPKLVNR